MHIGIARSLHPRIMMYSQDGFGLGHMRRTNSIASQILERCPNACILTLADSRLGQFFKTAQNHDYLKLPSILKIGQSDWRAVNLPLSFAEVYTIRQELIRSAALSFQPHVFLVDHMPHGAMGELLPTLETLKATGADTKIVLGLRDILDAPEVIQARWQAEGAYAAIERYYDMVLVYGKREVFDLTKQYGLSPVISSRLRYCGNVCTSETARHAGSTRTKYLNGANGGAKLIVAMAGGGADAYPMMSALLNALPAILTHQRCVLVLIAGPFMPAELYHDLQTRAQGLPVRVRKSVSDPLSFIESADLVVAMAGYNTTMEILRSGKRAILIPRKGPSAEQRMRAGLFASNGWVDVIDPDDLSIDTVAQAIVDSLERGPHVTAESKPDLQGLMVAVDHLLTLLPPAPAENGIPVPEPNDQRGHSRVYIPVLTLPPSMDHQFDFDPQLPALPMAFDLDAVARFFEEHWQKRTIAASPHPTIRICSLEDTLYKPAALCVTTYKLVVERAGAVPWHTIGVVEIRPGGLVPRFFDDDSQIPRLIRVIDGKAIGERFAPLLGDVAGPEAIEVREITPIRYKPGSRCVLRYELYAAARQRVFFGKLLARDGDRLMTTLSALHRASQTAPEMPRVPQPLAYWPDAQMVIQPAVAGGIELNAYAFDAGEDQFARERWIRSAGASLAGLHAQRCVDVDGLRRLLDDDLHDLQEYSATVAQVDPALATGFQAAISQIATLARDQVESDLVPSHGAFRTNQLMIEDSRLVLMDLDSFCWANSARDVGNFLAYLIWKAIRQPQHEAFIKRAAQAFLDGYMTAQPALDERWLALYRAASMLKIVGRRFRRLTFDEWPLVPQLLEMALASLAGSFASQSLKLDL